MAAEMNERQMQLVYPVESITPQSAFHKRLTYFIGTSGRTPVQVAQMIGVGEGTIRRWMEGHEGRFEPNSQQVSKLCHLFGITPNDLYGLYSRDIRPMVPPITRRERRYLELLTLNGQAPASLIRKIAQVINMRTGHITRLELILDGVTEVIQEIETLMEDKKL
jgi:transcriptional regulator with XRE-family HTH domain